MARSHCVLDGSSFDLSYEPDVQPRHLCAAYSDAPGLNDLVASIIDETTYVYDQGGVLIFLPSFSVFTIARNTLGGDGSQTGPTNRNRPPYTSMMLPSLCL
ncbi:hypothetical protein LshimejAT787_0200910 [Lyophyllum shimeji]|uniref:Uncharacterized protein n=1 Tax=Lyophyllum shimeji TaxID=47721 RepID=A0A9P3UKN2_LYOSH|nr:hypothetical protein LshimejAT787_0200910 [Lyophyllum shimeji]